jgi:ribose transport system permease protein/ribose transport system ATP-binding protein
MRHQVVEGTVALKSADVGAVTVEIVGVDKRFGPTHAVNDVTLGFDSAQITAIIGGNGAGKSTLMRMLAGEETADAGSISIDGVPIDLHHFSPRAAHECGVRIVHQELSLADSLTVAENFYVEHKQSTRFTWRRQAGSEARQAIEGAFGADTGIRPDALVGSLSVAQRQMVEIARAASAPGLRVLILDEPTSAMGREYLPHMQRLVRSLREAGVVVLVITHKMYELPALVDRVVVLRGGTLVADLGIDEADDSALVEYMTGATSIAEAQGASTHNAAETADEIVVAEHFSSASLDDISMYVRRGEIVGLAGLQGGGQADLLKAVLGGSQRGLAVKGRVAYVTGDRRDEGVFPLWSTQMNLAVSRLVQRFGLRPFGRSAADDIAEPWMNLLRLPQETAAKPILTLSGGMQQKVLFARGLALDADLLLLNDPTRGVDIHTKQELYGIIQEAASSGRGVLWCSSEDLEAARCDRVYVMADGRIQSEAKGSEISGSEVAAASIESAEDIKPNQATAPAAARHRLGRLLHQRWFLAALGLLATFLVIVTRQPIIASYNGLDLVLSLAPVLGLVGLAQMFVIALGDIDIGIGAYMGYVGVVAATALNTDPLIGWLLLLAGIALYPVVCLLIVWRKIPAIVVTLGMSFVWLGLALIVQPTVGGNVPAWLIAAYSVKAPLLPLSVWLLILLAVGGYIAAQRSRIGTLIRAVGSNEAAVHNAGWNTLFVRLAAYTITGTLGCLAGLVFAAIATAGDPNGTAGYTLIAIAAAIIGGSSFLGGRLSAVGVVLAATMLTLIAVLLSALAVPPVFTAAFQGGVLLAVMALRRIPAFRLEQES